MTTPDPWEKVRAAARNIAFVATFQGAAGWMVRSHLDRARTTLAKLTPAELQAASAAAAALSSMCDEVAGTR